MRQQLAAYLNNAVFSTLLAVVVLIPLLFTPLTTEFYETPKLILLTVAVLVLLSVWSLSWIVEGKVIFTRTPLDLSLLLLLIVVLISTFLSESRNVAIFGNFPRIHGSAVSWVGYILFYFVLASNLKGQSHIKTMLYGLLGAAGVLSLISLFSYFSLFLPFAFAKVVNFTPSGSSFSTTAVLALLLPVLTISIVRPDRFLSPVIAVVLATLFSLTIALTGTPSTQAAAIIGLLLVILASQRSDLKEGLKFLAIPIVITLIIAGLSYVSLGKKPNPLMQKRVDFPREVQLSAYDSWVVSATSFRDAPFFGSGPSTYLFNFTSYKPVSFNNSQYWNMRFDSAFNEYLQVWGTLGGLGLLAFLFFSAVIVAFAVKGLKHKDNNLVLGLSVTTLVAIVLLLLHTSTPVLMVSMFALFAILMGLYKNGGKVKELSLGIKASELKKMDGIPGSGTALNYVGSGDILPVILFIPILILILIALYQTYNTVASDFYHRKALNAAQKNALDTYNYLVKAENLNPRIDLYRVDLAQTNFALANSIAINKGPSESSPGGSLTDQDKANIQQLLSQSIAEARNATALSPRSAINWEILGSIYRQITGVAQNALEFSLEAYGRAVGLDPYNPLLRMNVGGIYYSVKNYDLAIRFFSDTVNLKPDFANGWYNLSIALRDKGDLQGAQQAAERVVSLLQKDINSPDYKTASEYLSDLKARIATGSAKESQITPPAASQNGALQQKDLPQVEIDQLKNTPQVATPPAVKR